MDFLHRDGTPSLRSYTVSEVVAGAITDTGSCNSDTIMHAEQIAKIGKFLGDLTEQLHAKGLVSDEFVRKYVPAYMMEKI